MLTFKVPKGLLSSDFFLPIFAICSKKLSDLRFVFCAFLNAIVTELPRVCCHFDYLCFFVVTTAGDMKLSNIIFFDASV